MLAIIGRLNAPVRAESILINRSLSGIHNRAKFYNCYYLQTATSKGLCYTTNDLRLNLCEQSKLHPSFHYFSTLQQDPSKGGPPGPVLIPSSEIKPDQLKISLNPDSQQKPQNELIANDKNQNAKKETQLAEPKPSFWQKMKHEIIHYYHGFRLLGLEAKIALGLCFQVLRGKTLSRRERKQLVRTVADIVRLVPFAVFLIVPFMEFLLPFYLKFFPFMLPSTFKDAKKEEENTRQVLKGKLEMAKFLQETLLKTKGASTASPNDLNLAQFQGFLTQVRDSGQLADPKDIARFTTLFEDNMTLDSLDIKYLKALCSLLEVSTIGPSKLLRFQLGLRVRQLKAEDRLIRSEGVDKIPPWELQNLCHERGMRAVGMTEDRMREQLRQWLELHLDQNVPITLLLISRVMYLTTKTLPDAQQLQMVIANLPKAVSEEVEMNVVESTAPEAVDVRTKIEILRQEQKNIKAERKAKEDEEAAEKKRIADALKATKKREQELLKDTAPVVKGLPGEELETKQLVTESGKDKELLVDSATTLPAASVSSSSDTRDVVTAAVSTAESVVVQPDLVGKKPAKKGAEKEEEETAISFGDITQIESAIADIAKNRSVLHNEELDTFKATVAEAAKQEQLEAAAAAEASISMTTPVATTASVEAAASPLETAPSQPPTVVTTTDSTTTVPTAPAAPQADIGPADLEALKPLPVPEAPVTADKAVKPKVEMTTPAKKPPPAVSTGATRLSAHVDRMLSDMDKLMDGLNKEKTDLLKDIELLEVRAKHETEGDARSKMLSSIRTEQDRVIDINELFLALRRIQKVPDDTRWQRILQVLDEDNDGKIEVDHVLNVVKLLGSENVKLGSKEMARVLEMIDNESITKQLQADQAKTTSPPAVPPSLPDATTAGVVAAAATDKKDAPKPVS